MMEGWIKMYRSIVAWEWFDCSEMVHIFIYLLASANHENTKWHGEEIGKGQMVMTVAKISKVTKISTQRIRTCLKRLEETGEINIEPTNKYTIITICNYERYQNDFEMLNKELTINQQSINNQLTTNKNDKNDKNIYIKETSTKVESKKSKSLAEQKETLNDRLELEMIKFRNEVLPYAEIYGTAMIEKFYSYWTEPNRSCTRMRFQLEKTWDTKRRIEYWARRENNLIRDEKHERPTKEQRDADIADLMARKLSSIGSH